MKEERFAVYYRSRFVIDTAQPVHRGVNSLGRSKPNPARIAFEAPSHKKAIEVCRQLNLENEVIDWNALKGMCKR